MVINLTGQKFGRLTVLRDDGNRDNNNNILWLCKCECGKEKYISSNSLRRGLTKSCGCIRCPDLTGKKFGKLIVLCEEDEKKRAEKRNETVWRCKCECGNETFVITGDLNSGHTQSCGCISGKDHANFKGCGEIRKVYFNNLKDSAGAAKRDIEFKVTIEYIWDLFLKQNRKCALTGVELKFSTTSRSGDGTASVDRIDSTKGYIEGNVQWVHKDINYMKQEQSEKHFIEWCKLVANHNSKI